MTGDEATGLIQFLKGLFPPLTSEQAFFLKREFLRYEVRAVESAIELHAKLYPAVSIYKLLEHVRENNSARREDWRPRSQAERKQSLEDRRQIDQALASLGEEDLERLKASVLAELPLGTRPFLERSDPRTAPVLRSLMYKHLRIEAVV